ncbi:MAG: hypothetical protein ACRDRO_16335 [Pseudonocardiaceae bacterium]
MARGSPCQTNRGAYQIAVADRATDDLDTGRRLVLAALAFLLTGSA